MSGAALRVRGLDCAIAGIQVTRALDLALEPGQIVGLLGRNGVGKSTLLHTLAGLRAARTGTINLDGAPIEDMSRRAVARRIGLLMQQTEDPFPTTVLETALIGRHPHLGFWHWEDADDVRRARSALAEVALDAFQDRDVHTLSGGERRRLAVATVLTQDPDVMLLDEPLDQLDLHHQVSLLEKLRCRARDRGCAILMSLHDLNLAARSCDRLLLLFGAGDHVIGATEAVLDSSNVERLYGTPVEVIEWSGGRVFVPR